MPELPKEKLSQRPVATQMLASDRLPFLRRAQDVSGPNAARDRNQTATREAVAGWLGALTLVSLSLGQAQVSGFTPAAGTFHAIFSANNVSQAEPSWNGDGVAQRTVLVQGLPGGSWASEGLLVLADGGSQRVYVDVAAGTYVVDTGNGPLLDIYGISQAKRSQVLGLFTSPSQFKAVDVALAGDTSTGLGSRFADFANGDLYELLPDLANADPDGNGTPTWLRL